jgi:hypothetical protein
MLVLEGEKQQVGYCKRGASRMIIEFILTFGHTVLQFRTCLHNEPLCQTYQTFFGNVTLRAVHLQCKAMPSVCPINIRHQLQRSPHSTYLLFRV